MPSKNSYQQIIEEIFRRHFREGAGQLDFARTEIESVANDLRIELPSNVGDVLYTYRYRRDLPASIRAKAARGKHWIIRSIGISSYQFALVEEINLSPTADLVKTKIPDGTPGIIQKYALGDEQALLAILRYNRLIDVFTGLTCYSLQNHLRTTVTNVGQIEIDELYVGINRHGAQYVIPVQAKGHNDRTGQTQIEQDMAACAEKFPNLKCRPIAAQFLNKKGRPERSEYDVSLIEFAMTEDGLKRVTESQYSMVPPDTITSTELARYHEQSLK